MLRSNRIADIIIVAGLILVGVIIAKSFMSDNEKPVGACEYKIPIIPQGIDKE